MYSLIVPVYKNEGSIPDLLAVVSRLNARLSNQLELVCVVDGSPDQSYTLLESGLNNLDVHAQLLALSRNFGSFAAIRAGLAAAKGEYLAVMAADLQEPPELAEEFFRILSSGDADVVVGTRESRDDPALSGIASRVFWGLYRALVVPEIPPGGVDVFGCNRMFRDQLLRLEETHTSLVALIFWIGFRRVVVPYRRVSRRHGKSAWTLRRKLKYLLDSVFAFTDLPLRLLTAIGVLGIGVSATLGLVVLIARLAGGIYVPGYAALAILILFFGAMGLMANGLVGSYVWRTYENSKGRPNAIVMTTITYAAKVRSDGQAEGSATDGLLRSRQRDL